MQRKVGGFDPTTGTVTFWGLRGVRYYMLCVVKAARTPGTDPVADAGKPGGHTGEEEGIQPIRAL